MKQIYFLLLMTIGVVGIKGQYEDRISYGIKAGANASSLSGIESMLFTRNNTSTDNTNKMRYGFVGGFFVNYRITEDVPIFGFQGELLYSMQGGKYQYKNFSQENVEVTYKYNYLVFSGLLKYYVWKGLNIGIGPQLGFNLSSKNIVYKSDNLFNDLTAQQVFQTSFKGQTDLSLIVGLGYEFSNGFMLEARYLVGLSDAIETQANSSGWVEAPNKYSVIQFTLGHTIPFFKD